MGNLDVPMIAGGAPARSLPIVRKGTVMVDPSRHDPASRRLPDQYDVLATITHSIGDGVWAVDAGGALLFMNSAAERLLGWTAAELLGMAMHDVVHRRCATGPCSLLHAMQSERIVSIDEDSFSHKDGTAFPTSYTVAPILSDGDLGGAVVAFRDITARKHSEAGLRLLAAIAASSDDAIMAKDMDDRITYWNPGAERLYGYSAAEMIGQPSKRLVPPELTDEMYHILERLRRGERVEHYETVRLRKDGSRFDVSVSVAPLTDAAGRLVGASAIARDITERKRAEQERAARAHQQAAMATLRQKALASTDLSTLMDEAVALVARTLDVEYGSVLEPLPDSSALFLRAGVGWKDGLVGRATVGLDSLAGYTLASSEPVIVADLHTETRFRGPSLLHDHGVVSSVSMTMGGHEQPVGVLEAHTTRRRLFTADDVHFLRAVANLLATISVRTGAEQALCISERRYRAIFEQSPIGLISYAPDGRLRDANQIVLDTVPKQQAVGYNVLADGRFVGVMGDIRRAFAGEAVRLPPLYHEERGRWMRVFLYPVKDEAGVVGEVVAMAEDITEQFQASQLLEQRVAERTRELSTLLEVSRNVASTLELKPLLTLILEHLKTVVDYTGATIFILEGEQLLPLDHRGPLSPEEVSHLRFPVSPAEGYQEARSRDGPIIVDDLWGDTLLAQAFREGKRGTLFATSGYARSVLAVPLMVKERVIGELAIDHCEPHYFTPQQVRLALTIANQAAVAIENARLYAQAQEMAVLEERARLARELHDAVTQTLFSASVMAELLPQLWDRDPAAGRQRLEDIRRLTRSALAEMRTLLLELRPTALMDAKLSDLLRHLVEALSGHKRLPITLTVEGDHRLPPDVQIAFYRVAQESLNNVVKHSKARAVEVRYRVGDGEADLRISDDGRGFEQSAIGPGRLGLSIMQERVEAVGAALTIQSRPGAGTQVRVVWREPQPEHRQ